MLSFAIEGITSFAVRPIRLIASLGIFITFISVLIIIWAIIQKCTGSAEAGWTSLLASVWMIGGIQLFCIGIIGEYIGKIYMESKERPRYIIESVLDK